MLVYLYVYVINLFFWIFFFRFKKNDELVVFNVFEKFVILILVEMNMKSGSVKVDFLWIVVNLMKYYEVVKLIVGNIV